LEGIGVQIQDQGVFSQQRLNLILPLHFDLLLGNFSGRSRLRKEIGLTDSAFGRARVGSAAEFLVDLVHKGGQLIAVFLVAGAGPNLAYNLGVRFQGVQGKATADGYINVSDRAVGRIHRGNDVQVLGNFQVGAAVGFKRQPDFMVAILERVNEFAEELGQVATVDFVDD
jgi:hypothetical protein